MATHREIEATARELGAEAGSAAASWYFDAGRSNITRADYLRVLAGIKNGDPEIMDTLPSSPLSGEVADDMTPMKLWELLRMNQRQVNDYGDEICTVYEEAFLSAAQESIEQEARSGAEQEFTFTLSVTLVEQDPQELLNDLEDVLNKHNLDIFDASWESDESVH